MPLLVNLLKISFFRYYKLFGIIAIIILGWVGIYWYANSICADKLNKMELDFRNEMSELVQEREEALDRLRAANNEVRVITKEVIKEVPTYINNSSCGLTDPGLRDYNSKLEEIYSPARQ